MNRMREEFEQSGSDRLVERIVNRFPKRLIRSEKHFSHKIQAIPGKHDVFACKEPELS